MVCVQLLFLLLFLKKGANRSRKNKALFWLLLLGEKPMFVAFLRLNGVLESTSRYYSIFLRVERTGDGEEKEKKYRCKKWL